VKSISAPAMAAIEAGEAIVTGAVEITPRSGISYTPFGTVDLDAVANAANNGTGGLSAGVDISGFGPTDTVRVTLTGGQAWNDHNGDADEWRSFFNAIPDGVAGARFYVGDNSKFATEAAAFAAFGSHTFTGASAYTLYIEDVLVPDNTGGLTIAVERGVAVSAGAGDVIRVWGGFGVISLDGEDYLPLGDRALAQRNAGAIGGAAQGLQLSLSGIEAAALELLDADEVMGASVVVRRLIFAADGKTLLDHSVWDRGRGDTIDADEVIGGAAAIVLSVESAARGLGRSGARQRSDSDQRLISSGDGYFKNTGYAPLKMLYWGGKRPARGGDATRGAGL
jgi:hypothetical protein